MVHVLIDSSSVQNIDSFTKTSLDLLICNLLTTSHDAVEIRSYS